MQVMGGIPINVQPPGGSGGGSTIPTIVADTTLNVPTDHATINAAIDYVLSCVVLNGAIVTINVESALLPIINEQIRLHAIEVPYIHLTNDGSVAINSTGFVNSVLGIPAWIDCEECTFGEISGTWTKGAGPACIGIFNLRAETTSGSYHLGPCSITGFITDLAIYGGEHTGITTTLNSVSVDEGGLCVLAVNSLVTGTPSVTTQITCAGNSTFRMDASSQITNAAGAIILACTGGSNASIEGNINVTKATINAVNGQFYVNENSRLNIRANITVDCSTTWNISGYLVNAETGGKIYIETCTFNFITLAPGSYLFRAVAGGEIITVGCSATVENPLVYLGSGGKFVGTANAWTIDHDQPIYFGVNGYGRVQTDTITVAAGKNPTLAQLDSGQIDFGNMFIYIGAASTAPRFIVNNGAMVQGTAVAAANWGADSQAPLAVLATGMIIA